MKHEFTPWTVYSGESQCRGNIKNLMRKTIRQQDDHVFSEKTFCQSTACRLLINITLHSKSDCPKLSTKIDAESLQGVCSLALLHKARFENAETRASGFKELKHRSTVSA